MKKIVLITLTLMLATVACKKQQSTSTQTEEKDHCKDVNSTYATVEPIFQGQCVKCHTAPKAAAAVDLNSYENTSKIANNGRLACVLKGESCKAMPPMGKLSSDDMLKMVCWIKSGAPN